MKFTPENLLTLPVGRYEITRKPYFNDYTETNELHVYLFEGKRKYKIGVFPEQFQISVDTGEEPNSLFFSAHTLVADSVFDISEGSLYKLTKYAITIPESVKIEIN